MDIDMQVPCGEMIGHGERCVEGWLCSECEEKSQIAEHIKAQAAEIERLQRSAGSWEADALRYAQNAEYWKAEAEKYKLALGGTIIWETP